MTCVVVGCGKPIPINRLKRYPGQVKTCSITCADENNKVSQYRSQARYRASKRTARVGGDMNTAELMAKLQELPPDMPVMLEDRNSDWEEHKEVSGVAVANWRKGADGSPRPADEPSHRWCKVCHPDDPDEPATFKAVVLQ